MTKKQGVKFRVLAIILTLVVMTASVFMHQTYEVKAADTNTIYTSDLYYTYPAYLKTSNSNVVNAVNSSLDALHNLKTDDQAILLGQTLLNDWESATIGYLGSVFGLETSLNDKVHNKAAEKLLKKLSTSEGNEQQLLSDSKDLQDLVDIFTNGSDWAQFFYEMHLPEINKDVIDKAVDENSSIIDDYGKELGFVYDAVNDAIEMKAMIAMLESIEIEQMDYIINHVDDELAGPIKKYKAYRTSNYMNYIVDKYIKKTVIKKIFSVKSWIKLIGGSGAAKAFDTFNQFCQILATAESDFTGLGSSADYLTAEILYRYVSQLQQSLYIQQSDIIEKPVYPSMITEYERGYNIYLAAVEAFADQASSVNSDYKSSISEATNGMEGMSVKTHYEDCKAKILSLPVDERKERPVDPDKVYSFTRYTGAYKVAGPSDELEKDTIYTGNGKTYYSIRMENTNVDFLTDAEVPKFTGDSGLVNVTSGHTLTADSIYICGVTMDIADSSTLHVKDQFTGAGNGYYTDGRTSHVDNHGTIQIDGKLYGDGDYGEYVYNPRDFVSMTMYEGTKLNVDGSATGWTIIPAGTMTFHDEVSINATSVPSSDTIIEANAPAGKDVTFGDLSFTANENDSQGCHIKLLYRTATSLYELQGNAPSYNVSSSNTLKTYELHTDSNYGGFYLKGRWKIFGKLTTGNIHLDTYGYLYAEEDSSIQIAEKLEVYHIGSYLATEDSLHLKAGSIIKAGSMIMDGTFNTVEKNASLDISGDMVLRGNNYTTDGRNSYLYNYGNIHVGGKLYGDGEYGIYHYSGSSVTHLNLYDGSVLTVDGDLLDTSGNIAGTMIVHGAVSYLGEVQGNGLAQIDAPAGKAISLSSLNFTPTEEDEDGCKLDLRYDADFAGYLFTVNAPSYNMGTDPSLKKARMDGPSYLNDINISYGTCYFDGKILANSISSSRQSGPTFAEHADVQLENLNLYKSTVAIEKGAKIDVKNDVKLTGNNYNTDGVHSYLNIYGTLKVGNELYGDGSYGIYNYSGSSVTHTTVYDGGTLEIDNVIRDNDLRLYGNVIFKGAPDRLSLYPSATASITVDTSDANVVKIAGLTFTPVEEENTTENSVKTMSDVGKGLKLNMRYDETAREYLVSFNAPAYRLTFSNTNTVYRITEDSYIADADFPASWILDDKLHFVCITHKWAEEYTIDREPGCATEGSRSIHCIRCDIKTKEETLPATGLHDYIEKVDDTYLKSEGNCINKAVYWKSCSVCGAKGTETFETVTNPTKHGETTLRNANDPTTTADGYTGDTVCTLCNAVITPGTSIPKLSSTETPGGGSGNTTPTNPTPGSGGGNTTPTNPTPGSGNGNTTPAAPVDNTITVANFTKTYSTKVQSFLLAATANGGARLTYSSNNSNITVDGSGKVTVKAKYIGQATITITSAATTAYKATTKAITVTVGPTKTAIGSVSNVKGRKMLVKWKKNTVGNGYQIQYSTNKKFTSGNKTVTISKNSTIKKTITGLKKGKTYFVHMRTYKKVGSVKYYSGWSAVKKVRISK